MLLLISVWGSHLSWTPTLSPVSTVSLSSPPRIYLSHCSSTHSSLYFYLNTVNWLYILLIILLWTNKNHTKQLQQPRDPLTIARILSIRTCITFHDSLGYWKNLTNEFNMWDIFLSGDLYLHSLFPFFLFANSMI